MNERERAERFERQLEHTMKDRQPPAEEFSAEELADLQVARRLLESDFSAGSPLRASLRERLRETTSYKPRGFALPGLLQGLAWTAAGLALVLLLSWSIGNLRPQPAVTQAAVAPVETNTPLPPTPAHEPTPTPALPEITAPLATAANIRSITWSPDGGWVGFLVQDAEQFRNSPGGEGYMPPAVGTLHFANLESGQACAYAVDNPQGLDFYRWYGFSPGDSGWLVLGRMGEIFHLPDPCAADQRRQVALPEAVNAVYTLDTPGGTAEIGSYIFQGQSGCWLFNAAGERALALPACSREASLSPGGGSLGMTLTEDGVAHRTTIIDTDSGETVFEHEWSYSDGGLGFLPAPQWLSETAFIVYRSDEGPLLVSLAPDSAITRIAPDLFEMQGAAHQYAYGQAGADGTFHIVLADLGVDYTRSDTFIYHGELGEVEALPDGSRFLAFSADGAAFEIEQSEDVDGFEQYKRYSRPLDPLGSPLEPYAPEVSAWGTITPDGRSLWIEITPAQIIPGYHMDLRSTETEESLQHWLVQSYTPERFSWSPYENTLVAIGSEALSQTQAIYLLQYR